MGPVKGTTACQQLGCGKSWLYMAPISADDLMWVPENCYPIADVWGKGDQVYWILTCPFLSHNWDKQAPSTNIHPLGMVSFSPYMHHPIYMESVVQNLTTEVIWLFQSIKWHFISFHICTGERGHVWTHILIQEPKYCQYGYEILVSMLYQHASIP